MLQQFDTSKSSVEFAIGFKGYVPLPIVQPHEGGYISDRQLTTNDILFGRGGKINQNPGNMKFRDAVHSFKEEYANPRNKKIEKAYIAAKIVDSIRSQCPPGRFLARDLVTGSWVEVGDEKARKKAGQALRDGANDRKPSSAHARGDGAESQTQEYDSWGTARARSLSDDSVSRSNPKSRSESSDDDRSGQRQNFRIERQKSPSVVSSSQSISSGRMVARKGESIFNAQPRNSINGSDTNHFTNCAPIKPQGDHFTKAEEDFLIRAFSSTSPPSKEHPTAPFANQTILKDQRTAFSKADHFPYPSPQSAARSRNKAVSCSKLDFDFRNDATFKSGPDRVFNFSHAATEVDRPPIATGSRSYDATSSDEDSTKKDTCRNIKRSRLR